MSASPPGPRRRPRLFWSAVVVATLLLGGGVVVAALGYAQTSGPDGAVRGYFAALARADAPAALGFGDLPSGPHTLLTSTVLSAQQRIAPVERFSIRTTRRNGDRANVEVEYTLAFPGDDQKITDTVAVRRVGDQWRLASTAVATQLELVSALNRATIVGAGIPQGTVLLFPGAVPISFDTPYLQLQPARDSVSVDVGVTTQVVVVLSDRGTRAVATAMTAALRSCLAAGADLRCPQPSERFVPGSVRGALAGPVEEELSVRLADGPNGSLEITGEVQVRGSYRKLGFDNRAITRSGQFLLPVHATAFAVAPVQITWTRLS